MVVSFSVASRTIDDIHGSRGSGVVRGRWDFVVYRVGALVVMHVRLNHQVDTTLVVKLVVIVYFVAGGDEFSYDGCEM